MQSGGQRYAVLSSVTIVALTFYGSGKPQPGLPLPSVSDYQFPYPIARIPNSLSRSLLSLSSQHLSSTCCQALTPPIEQEIPCSLVLCLHVTARRCEFTFIHRRESLRRNQSILRLVSEKLNHLFLTNGAAYTSMLPTSGLTIIAPAGLSRINTRANN